MHSVNIPTPQAPHHCERRASEHAGYVLISALLFLLIITLISITAMRTTALQQRMAGNLHDRQLAFRAAESALRDAEGWIAALSHQSIGHESPVAGQNIWNLDAPALADMATRPKSWWAAHSVQYPLNADFAAHATQTLAEIASPPHVIIQYARFKRDTTNIGKQPRTGTNYYRITAHGSGASDESAAIIRSSYGKRFR